MKIIVTGSLGHIGKPLTQLLVQKGHSVKVISTNPDRKKDIEALGAIAAIGVMEDVDFLTATFTGADVIHAMIPPDISVPNPMERNRKVGECLTEAIKRSGVKRVVYISSYGADLEEGTGLIVGHYHIEQALDKLELDALTHLRATYIYYNLYAYTEMIKKAGVINANYGDDDRVILVAPEDIAAAALEEIESNDTGRKVRYVSSDERSCNEIARILGEAIGKPELKWVTISNEQMRANMEARGLPEMVIEQFVEMFNACHTELLHHDYDQHKPAVMGKVKMEDFAKEFAAVFNQK